MRLALVALCLTACTTSVPFGWDDGCDPSQPDACVEGMVCVDISRDGAEEEERVCRPPCQEHADCPSVVCPGILGGAAVVCGDEEGYCREVGCR